MILYLGTSCLIQFYADETHSQTIRDWIDMAEIVATCRIAYTEVMSALDIRHRGGDLLMEDHNKITAAFTRDWDSIARLDFDDFEAGLFVAQYGLSRLGALHLSAAKSLARALDKVGPVIETVYSGQPKIQVYFASTDRKLMEAAAAEGLGIVHLG